MSPDPPIAKQPVVLLLNKNCRFNKFILLHSQQRCYYYRISSKSLNLDKLIMNIGKTVS